MTASEGRSNAVADRSRWWGAPAAAWAVILAAAPVAPDAGAAPVVEQAGRIHQRPAAPGEADRQSVPGAHPHPARHQRPAAPGEADYASGGDVLVFRPPVDAPVSDPFRMPDGPYGPGNRGIEYATSPGDAVRAGAEGVVSFAGPVAGNLYVTLDHGGGLLSSYSYIDRVSVAHGDSAGRGDVIGFTGETPLHFSVRIDGSYVDPAAFIGVRRVSVRLLPTASDR